MIHPQLKSLAVPIDSVTPDPENARKHPQRNIESIKDSLRQFGQRKPIIVQKEGRIVRAGNGTLESAKALGWTEIAAIFVDEEELQAKRFAVADNRTAELAEWDFEQLTKIFSDMPEADRAALGWADYEIQPLLASDWNPATVDPEFSAPLKDPVSKVYLRSDQKAIVDRACELYNQLHGTNYLPSETMAAICQEYFESNEPKDDQ
ncbi:MAG: hypothetical protein E6R03_15110 [Hyphomicrobiaceae bacterium]|nr:MAG: hypothetical protein E6R03_15110 [Hyphomicrobiaceae bacterium]